MNRLADLMVMDRTTLTRNLGPLQRRGLIRINPGKDQREREVTITKQGVGTLMKVYPLWKKAQSQVVEGLGQERMSRFLSDLSTLVEVTQAK
ncbi:MAG: winged helix-turn-helix transcriptional regulator [Deltaproteobacteria bacterium]|nr:winged helix-turn-helix transcriptional regulator [Deltaproteobacteria bacterium]